MMFKQLCRLQRYTFLHEPTSFFAHFLHEPSRKVHTFLHVLSQKVHTFIHTQVKIVSYT